MVLLLDKTCHLCSNSLYNETFALSVQQNPSFALIIYLNFSISALVNSRIQVTSRIFKSNLKMKCWFHYLHSQGSKPCTYMCAFKISLQCSYFLKTQHNRNSFTRKHIGKFTFQFGNGVLVILEQNRDALWIGLLLAYSFPQLADDLKHTVCQRGKVPWNLTKYQWHSSALVCAIYRLFSPDMVGEEQKCPTLCKMASEEASVFDREEEVVWYLAVSFLFPSPCSSDLNGLLVCVDY